MVYDRVMDTQIQAGKQVRLRSAHGEIVRVAVRIVDDVVLICRPEEYRIAMREGREPATVGFKLGDVL